MGFRPPFSPCRGKAARLSSPPSRGEGRRRQRCLPREERHAAIEAAILRCPVFGTMLSSGEGYRGLEKRESLSCSLLADQMQSPRRRYIISLFRPKRGGSMPADDEAKRVILRRLRRVEGQVRGIIRMVEEGKDCREVLNQVAAVRSAMERVGAHVITHHMKECLRVGSEDDLEKAVGEAVETFLRFTSSIS